MDAEQMVVDQDTPKPIEVQVMRFIGEELGPNKTEWAEGDEERYIPVDKEVYLWTGTVVAGAYLYRLITSE